jgi:integrase/recombinase XerC
MNVSDVYWQHRRLWIRLHEKGGKYHSRPCDHALAKALHAYIALAGIAEDRKSWLFPHRERLEQLSARQPAHDPV